MFVFVFRRKILHQVSVPGEGKENVDLSTHSQSSQRLNVDSAASLRRTVEEFGFGIFHLKFHVIYAVVYARSENFAQER